jgi:peptidoglycan/xylan/chitin deacetylase (PgdA/CDA1 family)
LPLHITSVREDRATLRVSVHDVPTNYPDGNGELWWLALEEIVARAKDRIELCRNGKVWRLPTATPADKERFEQIYWWLRSLDETSQRGAVRALADMYGVDMRAECRDLIMTWDEIRTMAADPLVTIGAHTKGHYAIAKLPEDKALDEMEGSADRIAEEIGTRPIHFAFPYGDPGSAGPRDFALAQDAGFETAATTRKGRLFADHRQQSDGAAARLPQRRLSVAHLHGTLPVGSALRLVEQIPAGQRGLTKVSRAAASSE